MEAYETGDVGSLFQVSASCDVGAWLWSVLSLELFFSLDHFFDTVVHVLDEASHGEAKSPSVGDVKDAVVGFGVLSVDASNLDKVFVSNCLEFIFLLSKQGQLYVDGSSHGSSKVGRAGGDVTQMVIVGELDSSVVEVVESRH